MSFSIQGLPLRGIRSALLGIIILGVTSVTALAEKRIALVVGNGAYLNVARLENPTNDARLMADTLRGLGFTLVGGGAQINLDKAGLDNAIASFGSQVLGADVGLFYYAGHGVQVRNSNFLVPVNANPAREADVYVQMTDVAVVLSQMEGSGTKLNLVILDACRNNPFGGRGLRATDPGLAQIRAPEGTLISYATQPGNVARDGADGDSPYTRALAQTMRRSGLDIFQTFNEVGLAVKRATGGDQQPWVSNSPIDGNFYFGGAPAPGANTGPAGDEIAWGFVKDSKDADQVRRFIEQFPTSTRRGEATSKLFALERAKGEQKLAIVAPPVLPTSPAVPPQQAAIAPPRRPDSPCGSQASVGVSLASRPAQPLSSAEQCALQPKDTFKECAECPEMIVVPAGSFMMGSPDSEDKRSSDEGPQHPVTIARPFAVGKFAVTNDEWLACVADGGCGGYKPETCVPYGSCGSKKPDDDGGPGRRPVVRIAWGDAKAYVAWLSYKTRKAYRLLSEAEREYVTRAGTDTPYWWGSVDPAGHANYNSPGPMPVDAFEPNPWGLYQVHGNVFELVEDCYHRNYVGAPADGSAWTTGDCRSPLSATPQTLHVFRGGAWSNSLPERLRAAYREKDDIYHREPFIGFRVARTL